MAEYNHLKIEKKWQKIWEKNKIYEASSVSKKPKFYSLVEFPYPSGDGLHTGHVRGYTAMDVISRKRRMEGFNVMYPIGWDAFGLPTENYAIKTGIQPSIITKKNTDVYRKQMKALGLSFDWSREINTTDPKYYKWTQWIFLQFLKKGLAYKAKMAINWCPKDKIGLANEEVVNGCCERCGTPVEKREKEQWMLAITKYAERLDKDLDDVNYLPQIKLAQRNWIGKSEGAEIEFEISGGNKTTADGGVPLEAVIKVFTTRPDTIFGATFLAVAPEVARKLTGKDFGIKADTDRENKEKIGADTGLKAKNPANGEDIPVWVVNYVSAEYGTGAIMAVPAHDERDFEFAKKYGLSIKQVIMPSLIDESNPPRKDKENTFRNIILAVLYNPKIKKYLILKWKEQAWNTFITGGVEEGEERAEAAKREIVEETGYKNFRLVRSMGFRESFFFAAHKNVNRQVHAEHFLFELLDEEQQKVSEEEKNRYDLAWISMPELEKTFMQHVEANLILENIKTGKTTYDGRGKLMNSGKFDGIDSEEAKQKITEAIGGKIVTKFKLRDWVFSRQRYWGEPIPVIFCDKCGTVPVPEKDLPVELPKVKNYQPTDSGESPLANVASWVNTKCPTCKGAAKRETDTMPNWAGSSWYYLRYVDPKNSKTFAGEKNLKYWLGSDPAGGGVNWYNGGNEHTTLHLLYSRFWHKFLFDLKLVPTSEPYMKRTSHGLILAEGGEKMSKSRGNVINPDDIVNRFGADTLRLYEMFMGPFDQAIAWSEEAMVGPRRFLERVWNLSSQAKQNSDRSSHLGVPSGSHTSQNFALPVLVNKTIKKVTEDIEAMKFNTAISTLMIFVNEVEKSGSITQSEYETLLKLLTPFAPHMTDELWHALGNKKSINLESWPEYDPSKISDEEVKIMIQMNGKVRGEFMTPAGTEEGEVKKKALAQEAVKKYLEGKEPKKVIYVKDKLINIVF